MALRMLAVIGQLQKIAYAQRPAKKRGQECKSPMQCSRGAMWAEWLQLGSHATSWNYIGTDSRYIVVGDAQVAI